VPLDSKGVDVAELAVNLDPKNAHRWLLLAHRIGAGAVVKLLAGGVRGVRGLDVAEKAVAAELERDKRVAAWLDSGGPVDVASTPARVPLLKLDGDSWLPGGIVGLVVAAGGSGKTTWLAELAVRVSHGLDFDGLWTLARKSGYPDGGPLAPAEQGPVLLVMAEEDRDGAAYQIGRACKVAGVKDAPHVHVWTGAEHDTALGVQVQLEDPVRGRVTTVVPSKFHDALCRKAREIGPLLVILDPLNQLLPTGGSENDAVTAGALIRLAGEIRAAAEEGRGNDGGPRPVVLIAHHERKAASEGSEAPRGSEAARGSTAFVDNARWVCRMTGEGVGGVEWTNWSITKSNYTRAVTVAARREYGANGLKWPRRWNDADAKALEAAKAKAKAVKDLADQSIENLTAELVKAGGGTPSNRRKPAKGAPPAPPAPDVDFK
jgi:hypothetical protein